MAAQEPASAAEVAQKVEKDLQQLEEEDKALAALEAELRAAELRAEAAQARFNVASRKVQDEIAEPMYKEEKPTVVSEEKPFVEDSAADSAEQGATEKHHKGAKNAGALSDKVVSSQRWLAKRAQENRVRDATKRARDRLRRSQRDQRADFGAGEAEAEAAPAADFKPPAREEKAKPRELVSPDTPEAAAGATGIADRLKEVQAGTDADKRGALAKVVTGGRDNYYTFDPSDVVEDLKARGHLDDKAAKDLLAIIDAAAPAKGKKLMPSQWLEHAKKVSGAEKTQQKPFTEAEQLYLKSVEDKALVEAEKELQAAEAHLQALIVRADALNLQEEADAALDRPRAGSGEVEVDQDYAAQLEEQHELQKESRGAKNTSTLTDKQASCKKWEANHNKEAREREQDKKARDARREEARDRKADAANAPDDA